MPDNNSEDPIIRTAADMERRAKIGAEKEARREMKKKNKKAAQPTTRRNAERLITWWRVQVPLPNLTHALSWAFVVAVVAGLIIAFIPIPFTRFFTPSLLDLFAFRILPMGCLLVLAAGAATWFRFYSWRKRLPFALVGWEELVDFTEFGEEEKWRHCSIDLRLAASDSAAANAFHAALVIFTELANTCYYASDEGADRNTWTPEGLTASGSVNRHVARRIKQLCEGNLVRLQRKYSCLQEVCISANHESFNVSRPRGGGAP